MDVTKPQNDRELLLQLNDNVQNLTISINNLGMAIKDLEEKKIKGIERRLDSLEKIWQQISGGWKLVLVLWAILTAGGIIGWLLLLINK